MIKAIAICGPTASGKTALSLRLSRDIPIEIISLDSMQIYRGMDIGTAKPTAEERSEIAHHMIDIVSPLENYSFAKYRESALVAAEEICKRGRLPVFVGGTGLYLDSLTRHISDDVPKSDTGYRERLLKDADSEQKRIALWERLREIDPESAEKIHYNNVKRVIRALEIFEVTGKPKSFFDKESKLAEREIDIKIITLDFHNRDNLYKRIDMRVDEMFSRGLYDEVLSLYRAGLLKEGTTAGAAIGYKEILECINGEGSLDAAKEKIKMSSRRYAKRQLTWYRHIEDRSTVYVDKEDGDVRKTDDIYREVLGIGRKVYNEAYKGS